MTRYRIVLKRGYNNDPYSPHMVQKNIFRLFWKTVVGDVLFWDRRDCEQYIECRIKDLERKRKNPKNIVIAEYLVK